ncbi:protein ARV1-like isoform X2 [Tubulanus polymorphus]|uniref:protein ARV1-like isoform X2 n=1 Tax=Tubulanus polymorphus TaxID=672921 RepID=UPI003DA5695A
MAEKKSQSVAENNYVCIECGMPAKELYKDFNAGIIKISHCKYCGKVVDKYIEYDPVIISLDAALHKRQAYRHVLYNTNIQAHWRFAILFLFCDTYTKWVNWPGSHHSNQRQSERDFIFYAALEWSFYLMFMVSAVEFITFYVVMNGILKIWKIISQSKKDIRNIIKGVLLSNMGKFYV